jgi:hypothetical protein
MTDYTSKVKRSLETYEICSGSPPACFVTTPRIWDILTSEIRYPWEPKGFPTVLKFFGIPVLTDPSVPPGTIYLMANLPEDE